MAIDAHIDAKLKPKRHKRIERKGSTSWEDTRIRPKDSAVCWKLCNFPSGITFGVRKELAVKHGLLARLTCPLTFNVDPSDVEFVGFVVTNDAGSLRRIDDVIDLFP